MNFPDDFDLETFRKDLLTWWHKNQRSYPWRETRDPYAITIAEVLLHRTRADQVVPTYLEFLKKYPSVRQLAKACIEEIQALVYPLGLRWRVDLLSKMAQDLHSRFNDQIPSKREELESLPGISHYIATAVRCFAFGYPDALLDTNTVRIVGRLLDIPVTDGSRRSREFRILLETLVDTQHPRLFNFALLDHGALVCRSRSPLCDECPVLQHCCYGRSEVGVNFVRMV
ncbi:MAG: DNA-binding protein [Candidatus Poribacteria bacterium]|nr:DNA-binding protein [Candidatus Poribacteria bacterium]